MATPLPGRPIVGVTLATLLLLGCGSADGQDPPPPTPTVAIVPVSGPGGTWVDVRARGFPEAAPVEIGLGPPRSEYEVVEMERTDGDGRVESLMQVPDWAESGQRYVFVVATSGDGPGSRVRASSDPFRVDGAELPGDGPTVVEGTLTGEGVECPTLETRSGTLYTLLGELGSFGEGDAVRVTGTPVEMSICMQGITLRVRRIEAAGG
jgi:hypothetical protein